MTYAQFILLIASGALADGIVQAWAMARRPSPM